MRLLLSVLLLLSMHAQATKPAEEKSISVFSIAGGLAFSDAYTIDSPVHLVDGVEPVVAGDDIRVVVEIPTGSVQKWEADKTEGNLKWELRDGSPRVINYLGYPGNYGMIPRTLQGEKTGGDGDPLDALVIGQAVPRGSIVTARLIGILNMTDKGMQDDKLIAVLKDSPFEEIYTIKQLDKKFPDASTIIRLWFANYKGQKKIAIEGYSGRKGAREALSRGISDYIAHTKKQVEH
ncbi:MAG: inorganic diphosphatase [Halioglobus sp.]|nr:inorganic diphosphatase [Halioglobus sp.]